MKTEIEKYQWKIELLQKDNNSLKNLLECKEKELLQYEKNLILFKKEFTELTISLNQKKAEINLLKLQLNDARTKKEINSLKLQINNSKIMGEKPIVIEDNEVQKVNVFHPKDESIAAFVKKVYKSNNINRMHEI